MTDRTIPAEAVEAAEFAVAKEMRDRTYDRHAYSDQVFLEGVTDIARAALEAAAPHMLAAAFDQGQKSGMRHADRLIAAAKIGKPELPGPLSPNPYMLNAEGEK